MRVDVGVHLWSTEMIFGNEYQSSTAQRMFPQPGNLWFTLVFGIQLVDVPNEVMKKIWFIMENKLLYSCNP